MQLLYSGSLMLVELYCHLICSLEMLVLITFSCAGGAITTTTNSILCRVRSVFIFVCKVIDSKNGIHRFQICLNTFLPIYIILIRTYDKIDGFNFSPVKKMHCILMQLRFVTITDENNFRRVIT